MTQTNVYIKYININTVYIIYKYINVYICVIQLEDDDGRPSLLCFQLNNSLVTRKMLNKFCNGLQLV